MGAADAAIGGEGQAELLRHELADLLERHFLFAPEQGLQGVVEAGGPDNFLAHGSFPIFGSETSGSGLMNLSVLSDTNFHSSVDNLRIFMVP